MKSQLFMQAMLPRFSEIDPVNIEPSIRAILSKNKQKLEKLLSQSQPYTWDNLMQPLEDMSDELNRAWSPIGHLHAVLQSDALRKAYNDILPVITTYHTEMSQNEHLFNAIAAIAASPAFADLNPAQRKLIENDIRDFKLAGIHLPPDKKLRMAALEQKLSQLTTQFSENVLDATGAWHLHLPDLTQIAGLPPSAQQLAKENAERLKLPGYAITLDYPSYSTAIKFLHDRDSRQKIYEAYVTRASDAGPNAGKWDNTQIMEDILNVRHEMAQLVGFNNDAEYSLATKMAKTPEAVLHFLNDLTTRSKPIAKIEYEQILAEAAKDGLSTIDMWDVPYYSEKLQLAQFHFNQEDCRPYFPVQKVLSGLFAIVNQLYGITMTAQPDIETWHPDAHFYAIHDDQHTLRGGFYIDLYARPQKRDGAWMDECRSRKRTPSQDLQLPVAYLTCNFMPPTANEPARLTHDDVITLFHEFGHCLHHLLTQVDYPSVAGINGVPWDAVEFPSQFMENYCWEKASLALIAEHLPDDLYQKMIAAKHFQTGLQMIRQLELSLFDFRLHLEYDPTQKRQVQSMLDQVRQQTAIAPTAPFNRFQHSFSHIFAGGYAAGYYSYKWAEVLSADAYAQFEENGIFDSHTGHAFMENILAVGGVRDPMASFIAFRGREPTIDALLKQNGLHI